MLLAIDAGNTNLTLGWFADKNLVAQARLATDRRLTADQLAMQIAQAMQLHGIDPAICTDAVIASVVAELTNALAQAAQMLTGRQPLVIAPGVKTGLDIRIDNPAQLGADFIATAVAAKARFPLPCLVVDLGTASKISVLGACGGLLGGSIAAGVGISMEAMAVRTSALPRIALHAPPRCIGTNTIDCMQSGTVLGTAAMIDGMVARMEAELGQPATVVATGGLSGEIIRHCMRDVEHCPDLALLGLCEIYAKNRGD